MAEEIEGEEKKKRGKKAIIIPLVVLLAGFGGGGYFFMSGKKTEAVADPNTTTTIALGSVIRLSPITMNLSDGHVLKVGMALQAVAVPQSEHMKAALGGGAGHGAAGADATASPLGGEEAKALDEAIHVLGDMTYEELSKPGGRAAAKAELSEKIKHIYHDDITEVYFTDFVMS